jgi:hypothetical protein
LAERLRFERHLDHGPGHAEFLQLSADRIGEVTRGTGAAGGDHRAPLLHLALTALHFGRQLGEPFVGAAELRQPFGRFGQVGDDILVRLAILALQAFPGSSAVRSRICCSRSGSAASASR